MALKVNGQQHVEPLASFSGMDQAAQVARSGMDQRVEPPDTQMAAGPDSIVEATNATLSVWSKTGTLIFAGDLNPFFGLQGSNFSDPRVLYDAASNRWFLSGLAFGTSGNATLLAVSATADPSGAWMTYGAPTSYLPDQPKIGISADKVVIAFNDFSPPASFAGAEEQVIEKSDLVALSNAPRSFAIGPYGSVFSPVPAIEQTPTSSEFLAYNPQPLGSAGTCLEEITGTPAAGNVNETDVCSGGYPATSIPPPAVQAGSSATIQTNDDRFLTADWRNGTLWVAANDGCVPSGDSATRSCIRLVQMNVSPGGSNVSEDFDVAISGTYLYFPAVAMDASGNLLLTFTGSSASLYPSVYAMALPGGSSAFAGGLFLQGPGPYNSASCGGANRFGDYSAASTDPSNPNDVWLAAEVAGSNSCDWSTSIARVSLSAPTISALTPALGSVRGGTTVTIAGSEFAINDTTVSFGGTTVPGTLHSSEQLSFVTPLNSSGCASVPVSVSTSQGTSSTVIFGYAGWPCAATIGTGGSRGRQPPPLR